MQARNPRNNQMNFNTFECFVCETTICETDDEWQGQIMRAAGRRAFFSR